jgi:PAS domain S-box-containing protein
MSDLSGYNTDEVVGKSFGQMIGEEGRDRVAYVLLQALTGQDASDIPFPLIVRDPDREGEYTIKELAMNVTARRGPDGDITGCVAVVHDLTEVQHLVSEQKAIAEDMTMLIRTVNTPILAIGMDGKVTEWNNKVVELTGYSKEEAIGMPLVEQFVAPSHHMAVAEVIHGACRGVATANVEVPILRKDGKQADILLNASPRKSFNGQIVGVVGVAADVNSLKSTMMQNSFAADDVNRIMEMANSPIFAVDKDFNVTEYNAKLRDISGLTSEDVVGKPMLNLVPPERRDSLKKIFKEGFAGVDVDSFELPIVGKNGTHYPFIFGTGTRRTGDGRIIGLIHVGQDLSKWKAVAEQGGDASQLVSCISIPIVILDARGLITEWNAKAEEMSGFAKSDVEGQSFIQCCIHKVHQSSVQLVLDQVLSSKKVGDYEFQLYSKSGDRKDIQLMAFPRMGPGGQVTGIFCQLQDLTELNEKKREARQVSEDRDRLVKMANAAVIGVDSSHQIDSWGNWLVEKTGWDKGDVMGRKLVNFVGRSARKAVTAMLDDGLGGKPAANQEISLDTKDGTRSSSIDRHGILQPPRYV